MSNKQCIKRQALFDELIERAVHNPGNGARRLAHAVAALVAAGVNFDEIKTLNLSWHECSDGTMFPMIEMTTTKQGHIVSNDMPD